MCELQAKDSKYVSPFLISPELSRTSWKLTRLRSTMSESHHVENAYHVKSPANTFPQQP